MLSLRAPELRNSDPLCTDYLQPDAQSTRKPITVQVRSRSGTFLRTRAVHLLDTCEVARVSCNTRACWSMRRTTRLVVVKRLNVHRFRANQLGVYITLEAPLRFIHYRYKGDVTVTSTITRLHPTTTQMPKLPADIVIKI